MKSCWSRLLIIASAAFIFAKIIAHDHDLTDPQKQQHTNVNKDPKDAHSNNADQNVFATTATVITPGIITSIVKEAEDAKFDSSSKFDAEHAAAAGANSNVYIDMGGMGSWVEFHVDHDGVTTTTCKLSFRYSNGASNRHRRPCSVSLNGVHIGTLYFPSTLSWNNWSYAHMKIKQCIKSSEKNTKIRITATTEEGGPNIDSMEWTATLSYDDSRSTLSSSPIQPEIKQTTTKRRKCNYQYNKLPEGQITYGLDDGGCFLCMQENPITSKITTQAPSSGNALIEQCQQLCDTDSQCVAFTVARTQSLPPQLYRFGTTSNCCLERTVYPPGVYLGTQPTTTTVEEKKRRMASNRRNDCQLDAMCWTRYEKIPKEEEAPCDELPVDDDVTVPHTSKMICSRVWEPTTYTDDEVQTAINFINDGCQYSDKTYMSMLARANARCEEEILAESLAISIIVHSSGMMTHVTVGQSI